MSLACAELNKAWQRSSSETSVPRLSVDNRLVLKSGLADASRNCRSAADGRKISSAKARGCNEATVSLSDRLVEELISTTEDAEVLLTEAKRSENSAPYSGSCAVPLRPSRITPHAMIDRIAPPVPHPRARNTCLDGARTGAVHMVNRHLRSLDRPDMTSEGGGFLDGLCVTCGKLWQRLPPRNDVCGLEGRRRNLLCLRCGGRQKCRK